MVRQPHARRSRGGAFLARITGIAVTCCTLGGSPACGAESAVTGDGPPAPAALWALILAVEPPEDLPLDILSVRAWAEQNGLHSWHAFGMGGTKAPLRVADVKELGPMPEASVLRLVTSRLPPHLREALAGGRTLLLDAVPEAEELLRAVHPAAMKPPTRRPGQVVPLTTGVRRTLDAQRQRVRLPVLDDTMWQAMLDTASRAQRLSDGFAALEWRFGLRVGVALKVSVVDPTGESIVRGLTAFSSLPDKPGEMFVPWDESTLVSAGTQPTDRGEALALAWLEGTEPAAPQIELAAGWYTLSDLIGRLSTVGAYRVADEHASERLYLTGASYHATDLMLAIQWATGLLWRRELADEGSGLTLQTAPASLALATQEPPDDALWIDAVLAGLRDSDSPFVDLADRDLDEPDEVLAWHALTPEQQRLVLRSTSPLPPAADDPLQEWRPMQPSDLEDCTIHIGIRPVYEYAHYARLTDEAGAPVYWRATAQRFYLGRPVGATSRERE